MSLENGWDLDSPEDWFSEVVKSAQADYASLPVWAKPVVVPATDEIGEPDSASIDEMPRPSAVRETDYWERTDTVIERFPGHSTHKLSFVTKTRYGSDTTIVRLTRSELIDAFRVLVDYLAEFLGSE
jgi:hypothetical protein